MQCPACNSKKTKTTNSRTTTKGRTRRRKECINCNIKFSSYEILDELYFDIFDNKHEMRVK